MPERTEFSIKIFREGEMEPKTFGNSLIPKRLIPCHSSHVIIQKGRKFGQLKVTQIVCH